MKKLNIIQISDLHGNFPFIDSIAGKIKSADLVALSGDITNFGGRRRAAEIVDAVLSLNPAVVAIAGNWDRAGVGEYLRETDVSVDGAVREINGFIVCGLGGSLPAPVPAPNELSEEQFRSRLKKLAAVSASPDILIIHQPPANTKLDRISSGPHVGSEAVKDYIERSGAIVCLTGHIHESSGIDELGKTKVVNPGAARQGRYAVIGIEGRSVSVELKTGEG